MKRADMKDIVDCLEYIQDNQRRQDDRMNIIIDKLNYLMVQREHIKNECKKKLNEIYGYKYYHFLSTSEIYEVIPYATFDLSINIVIVKRKCTWPEFFDMKEGIYNKPLDTKIDLKNALAHVVHVEIGKSGKTDVNLMAIVREGEFYFGR